MAELEAQFSARVWLSLFLGNYIIRRPYSALVIVPRLTAWVRTTYCNATAIG